MNKILLTYFFKLQGAKYSQKYVFILIQHILHNWYLQYSIQNTCL